jgi:hypothetical protein
MYDYQIESEETLQTTFSQLRTSNKQRCGLSISLKSSRGIISRISSTPFVIHYIALRAEEHGTPLAND